MCEWKPEIPTEKGLFWFYGYRYGKMSCGHEQKKELLLVRVNKNKSGDCLLVAEGTFMFKGEIEDFMFSKVDLPALPNTQQ